MGRVVKPLAQAARGSDGITIPRSAQKPWRCGTWGHGSEALLAVPRKWLGSLLGVFPNLNHSMIQWNAAGGDPAALLQPTQA